MDNKVPETPEQKAERLRARKAKNQKDRRNRPPGMSLYKVWAIDAHVEAILEWQKLLNSKGHHRHADVEAALEKLIATLEAVLVTGDNTKPNFPAI